jgi:CRISPR-associated protein Cas2
MARVNKYRGVLRPIPLGKGSPDAATFVLYDIEEDRLRTRVADICLNYGLSRVQYSAFFGRLNRNLRQELALRIQGEVGLGSARVKIFPLCEEDLKDMWSLDRFHVDADQLKEEAEEREAPPRLRVVKVDD